MRVRIGFCHWHEQQGMQLKALSGGLFIVAVPLLYYGVTMLLLVPGYPGEHYLSVGRLLYGGGPTLASIAVIVLAAKTWSARRVHVQSRIAVLLLLATLCVLGFYGLLYLIAARQVR
ncbi:MAG: hypothetical protein ABI693_30445 [Bryobacteraceae bacterium]